MKTLLFDILILNNSNPNVINFRVSFLNISPLHFTRSCSQVYILVAKRHRCNSYLVSKMREERVEQHIAIAS
jgi:hypothetical protein